MPTKVKRNEVEELKKKKAEVKDTLPVEEKKEEKVYKAKIVNCGAVNVREGAGKEFTSIKTISTGSAVMITEEKNGFGKLKGKGWVCLKYVMKV